MKINIKSYKYLTVVATVLSAIFIFPSWFLLSIPMLDSILESGSLHISFFTLPDFISEHGLVQMITNTSGKTMALIVLLISAILKYMCVLSAGLGLYGAVKICVKKKPSRFILSSQIIALVLSFISVVIVVAFALILNVYSQDLATIAGISEKFLDINFIPSICFYLSLASSVASIVFSVKYSKE